MKGPVEADCPLAEYIEAQLGWHDHDACLRVIDLWESCAGTAYSCECGHMHATSPIGRQACCDA